MQKILKFLEKYGLIIHPLSIGFWIWVIFMNVEKIQAGGGIKNKISLGICIVLLCLSSFNLYTTVLKRFNRS